jgi:hypothetical protein
MLLQDNQITSVKLLFYKLQTEREISLKPGEFKLEYKIGLGWNLYALHKENKGAQFRVTVNVQSAEMKILIEAIAVFEFNLALSEDDMKLFDNEKKCILKIVDNIIIQVGRMTPDVGFSPLLLDRSQLTDIINRATR